MSYTFFRRADLKDVLKCKGESMKLEDIISQNIVLSLDDLKADEKLLKQIQTKLNALGLYPGGQWIDGDYGGTTENALKAFCAACSLPNMDTKKFDKSFAGQLTIVKQLPFILEEASAQDKLFNKLWNIEQKWLDYYRPQDTDNLAFLDRLIDYSPYDQEIDNYPDRLKGQPDGKTVISYGATANLSNPNRAVTFSSYPKVGTLPQPAIDDQGLSFLLEEITEACVCVGSFVGNELKAHWLGKNALHPVQLLSSTKFIPILNVVCQANAKSSSVDVDNCNIRGDGARTGYQFYDFVEDVVTYAENIGTSNSIAAMFKRFQTRSKLEQWVKDITGNKNLNFQGDYGEPSFYQDPELFNRKTGNTVLGAALDTSQGKNYLSAYDLTRFVTMLGWHYHIAPEARLPGAQGHSLESVIRAMGRDRARYIDVAIETLGLENVLSSVVIISKLGLGDSGLCYVALTQFVDEHLKTDGQPGKLRTLGMALRVDRNKLPDSDTDASMADAKMAAAVTEIIRRVVTEELA